MDNNTTITYRGAKAPLSKVVGRRAGAPRQPVSRTVQYRGATANVALTPHQMKKQNISYRGATAEMEV